MNFKVASPPELKNDVEDVWGEKSGDLPFSPLQESFSGLWNKFRVRLLGDMCVQL